MTGDAKKLKSLGRKRSKILLDRLARVESPDTTFMSDTYPIVMKKASGMYVRDIDGNRYTDMTACFGVLALGHRAQATMSALRKQSAKLIHGMGDVHPSDAKIRLLELLNQMLPYKNSRCILGLSGSDAIEAAMKTALRVTGRKRFLVFDGSYHGLGLGAMQLTSRAHFREGLDSWSSPLVTALPFPLTVDPAMVCPATALGKDFLRSVEKETSCASAEEVLALLKNELDNGDVAALFCEPIQGRAGDRTFPQGFLAQVQTLCAKAGALLVFDEIYTGFGRTGKLFAFEHHGVVPDLLCLGKALGGGLPLSACVGDVVSHWPVSTGEARHTSTFLGNPLACACGHATLKEIRKLIPAWQSKLAEIDKLFVEFLNDIKKQNLSERYSFEIRGTGYMRGFWFFNGKAGVAAEISEALLNRGYITLPSGPLCRVLSWTPPLTIETKVVKIFLRVLAETILEHSLASQEK